jgi:hypothetical protein
MYEISIHQTQKGFWQIICRKDSRPWETMYPFRYDTAQEAAKAAQSVDRAMGCASHLSAYAASEVNS